MKTVFLRALGADDKAAALREAIRAFRGLNHPESVNTRLRAEVFERISRGVRRGSAKSVCLLGQRRRA